MAKHWFPVFSFEKCTRCGKCVSSCPERILSLELQNLMKGGEGQTFSFQSHFPVLKYPDFCRPNCFECAKACQNKAVGILRPSKPCDCCF